MTNKTSELFDAVYAGDIDKVKVCILSGAVANAINHSGDKPLIEAIASDNAKRYPISSITKWSMITLSKPQDTVGSD